MQKKILVLGLGQNNFLSFLYGAVKKKDSDFFISAPFFTAFNNTSHTDSWMYSNDKIVRKISFVCYLKSAFSCLLSKHFYQTLFFILFVELKFSKTLHFVVKQMQAKAFFIANQNFNDYDIFHFHFMQYSYLKEVFMVPKNKKIVCTFWGSDLLRTSDIFNFYFVKKALNKATTITCQTAELREVILSKYGRNLLDKIEVNMFPLEESIYQLMKSNATEVKKISQFKAQFNYSPDKINVLIGHNGSIFNNHLQIINALQHLRDVQQFHLIVNLNYAITENQTIAYKNELNAALTKTNCSYTILENFFSGETLALSRLATDVFVHAPVSDAISSTMLEMLYAGSVVIAGSWLPYKTFKNAQLKYHEIVEFEDISKIFNAIALHFNEEKQKMQTNTLAVENYFLNDKIATKWCRILQ
ncbi:MAG: hypothetical protein PSV16_10800 [Flavobacterium sp.]|nr:hypothetical protein [Flavobacterium sp.]